MILIHLSSFSSFPNIIACNSIVTAVGAVSVGTFFTISSHYATDGTEISDGGNDMYDVGNCISVPATSTASTPCSSVTNKVTYKRDCDESTVNGQTYKMWINNNAISVLYFPSYSQNTISINGNLGSDGGGNIASGSYEYNGWKGYWKVTWGQGSDPGVNHLWMTNAPSTVHTFDSTRQYDYDELLGVNGYSVVYLMWATAVGTRSSDSAMQQIIQAIL